MRVPHAGLGCVRSPSARPHTRLPSHEPPRPLSVGRDAFGPPHSWGYEAYKDRRRFVTGNARAAFHLGAIRSWRVTIPDRGDGWIATRRSGRTGHARQDRKRYVSTRRTGGSHLRGKKPAVRCHDRASGDRHHVGGSRRDGRRKIDGGPAGRSGTSSAPQRFTEKSPIEHLSAACRSYHQISETSHSLCSHDPPIGPHLPAGRDASHCGGSQTADGPPSSVRSSAGRDASRARHLCRPMLAEIADIDDRLPTCGTLDLEVVRFAIDEQDPGRTAAVVRLKLTVIHTSTTVTAS